MTFGITFIFVGIFSLVFGYLLAYKHRLSLINGYDPKKISDPEKYAEHLGKAQIVTGFSYLIIGTLGLSLNIQKILAIIALIISVGFITRLVLIQKKYSIKKT